MEGAARSSRSWSSRSCSLLGLVLGAINGASIVITRVPDIIVTLAMLFVWQGAALLVLEAPGRRRGRMAAALVIGTVSIPGMPEAITQWMPKALVLLVVCLGIVWMPLHRSSLGLSIYAIGSNTLAAFRSGVGVARTKIVAYARGGAVRRHGRPGADAEHRHRRADPRPLSPRQRRRGGARRASRWAAARAA